MSRRRSMDTEVTLLPFLAVLVCTMGALIVLLVVVMQQAQVGVVQADLAKDARSNTIPIDSVRPIADSDQSSNTRDTLSLDLFDHDMSAPITAPLATTGEAATETFRTGPTADDVAAAQKMRDEQLARIEALNQMLSQSQLAKQDKNTVLGQVDTEIESLLRQLNQLQQTVDATSAEFAQNMSAPSQAKLLAEAERQLSDKQAELASIQTAGNNEPATYHIVPYSGSGGTSRRPIYIECLPGKAVIQPEGVVLTRSDFATANHPDNVLAATLRTIRDHWLRNDVDSDRGDAYPLLVVRPGGEASYHLCRDAMKAWDDEFGYELVDTNVRLEYPEPNEALAAAIRETQSLARQRQQQQLELRQALVRDEGPSLRASRSGGFARQGSDGSFSLTKGRPRGPNRAGMPNATGMRRVRGNPDATSPPGEAGGARRPIGSSQFASNDRKRHGAISSPPGAPRPQAGEEGATTSQPPQLGSLSLAQKRGKDWALPNAVDDGIPLERPLYVEMNRAQIVLEAEPGTRQVPAVISLEPGTTAAVQSMVTSIWDRIATWGAAGPGVYWRPRLEVKVAPGSEDDFQRLARLLDGSGLEVAQTKSDSIR